MSANSVQGWCALPAHLRSLPYDEHRPALEVCGAPRGSRCAWRRAPRFPENAVLAADHRRRPANERHAPPRWWRKRGKLAAGGERRATSAEQGGPEVPRAPSKFGKARLSDRTISAPVGGRGSSPCCWRTRGALLRPRRDSLSSVRASILRPARLRDRLCSQAVAATADLRVGRTAPPGSQATAGQAATCARWRCRELVLRARVVATRRALRIPPTRFECDVPRAL